MVKWFGTSWGAPICEEEDHVSVPVGSPCARCGESIEAWESGLLVPHYGAAEDPSYPPYHRVCFLAMIMPITVHGLLHGLPLCGFTTNVPAKWPMDQTWDRNANLITCEECRRRSVS